MHVYYLHTQVVGEGVKTLLYHNSTLPRDRLEDQHQVELQQKEAEIWGKDLWIKEDTWESVCSYINLSETEHLTGSPSSLR